jgi:peptide/nickel transport system permease protein
VRRYLARRLLLLVPVLAGVSIVIFMVLHLSPGDPVEIMLGSQATQEDRARLRADLGLDQPLPVQYVRWLGHVVRGDLGRSLWMRRPVLGEVLGRFKATLILTGTALLLSTVVGIALGVASASRPHSLLDRTSTVASLFGASMPSFWLGIVLMVLFALRLGWLPASGMYAPYGGGDLRDLLAHLVLPAVTLAAASVTIVARLTRAAMLETLGQDYIRTARAKGVVERMVVLRHGDRRAGRLFAGGRRAHRDGVRVAGCRHPDGAGHPGPRLPARAGLCAGGRAELRADQSGGRPPLRMVRPAHPLRVTG